MDVVMKEARNDVLHEILYADNLVLISESMEDLQRQYGFMKSCSGK